MADVLVLIRSSKEADTLCAAARDVLDFLVGASRRQPMIRLPLSVKPC